MIYILNIQFKIFYISYSLLFFKLLNSYRILNEVDFKAERWWSSN